MSENDGTSELGYVGGRKMRLAGFNAPKANMVSEHYYAGMADPPPNQISEVYLAGMAAPMPNQISEVYLAGEQKHAAQSVKKSKQVRRGAGLAKIGVDKVLEDTKEQVQEDLGIHTIQKSKLKEMLKKERARFRSIVNRGMTRVKTVTLEQGETERVAVQRAKNFADSMRDDLKNIITTYSLNALKDYNTRILDNVGALQ